jgi:hypothetical protein
MRRVSFTATMGKCALCASKAAVHWPMCFLGSCKVCERYGHANGQCLLPRQYINSAQLGGRTTIGKQSGSGNKKIEAAHIADEESSFDREEPM